MAFATVATIITDAAIELGLTSSSISNPYTSTDPNILQLNALLKRSGRTLVRAYPWSHLATRYTFNTSNGTASYALPTPFARIIDQTTWNTTSGLPLHGPLNAMEWESEKARTATAAHQFFRIWGNLFYIHATPSATETIAYEYISGYWVDTGGGTTPDAEHPTTSADTLFLEQDLLVCDLRRRFLKAKGFDSTAAEMDFQEAYARATGADGAAPVLHMSGVRGFRYLDESNLPDSDYGS